MSPRRNPKKTHPAQLRLLRESLGLTREEAGAGAGYSSRQIARWEGGQTRVREVFVQYLLGLRPKGPPPESCDFTFIDLFAGIGGFRMGLESAGGRCVFTSEWDDFAQITYKAKFGDHEVHGDITQIDPKTIPDHDVLAAGFPCQPFSIAGVSKKNSLGRKHGFECETQGTLFFNIEKIIAAKQPKAFVLENVKNLASHDRGRTFDVIMRTLKHKLKYDVEPLIVDAGRFLPQHRERILIVGLRPDLRQTFDWENVVIPPVEEGPKLGTILHPEDGSGTAEERFTDKNGRPLPKYVLTEHLWRYLRDYAAKHQRLGNGFGFGLVGPDDVTRTLSARYYKDGSEILVRREGGRPRRLTPRECSRLMGFDRPQESKFPIVVSDTQAYRQFGNAVAVPVVRAIAKALAPYVTASKPARQKRSVGAA